MQLLPNPTILVFRRSRAVYASDDAITLMVWRETLLSSTYRRLYFAGSGYELYDPYSGNVTVVVGPAPHYGGPGGGLPVLAAVPCQPLPLQPLEWFNPAFLPYVTAPCHNGHAAARDRRKRYSTDSQVRRLFFLRLKNHKMALVNLDV
jgi:hypothetical protein